jgi:stage II sporulation protein D
MAALFRRAVFPAILVLSLFLLTPQFLVVNADTEQQINQAKTKKQQELSAILKEISTISSSSASLSSKLSDLRSEKTKLEKLLKEMSADLSIMEKETVAQEEELVQLANKYSLQQALYSVQSQKGTLITFFESPDLTQMMDNLLYYQVQARVINEQNNYIQLKKSGIDIKKKQINDDQVVLQKSLSEVSQRIAELENQQQAVNATLSKSYAQRNALVSDISKLTRAAQKIINDKANAVTPPSGGVGSGSGSGGPTPTPIMTQPPSNTSGAISVFVGGTFQTRTDNVIKVRASGNEITLKGTATVEFPGTLEFNKTSGVYAINEVSLDQYLWGLAEMPSSWHAEALKAQAIAGRSYAVYKMRYGGYGKFDLYDSVQDQEYVGLGKVKSSYGTQWKTAVEGTSNTVLEYGGATLQALYSAESGGHTLSSKESPSFGGTRAYLQAKPDRFLDGLVWKPYGDGPRSYWKQQTNVNTMALLQDYLNGAIYYDLYKTVKSPSEQSASSLASALGTKSITSVVGTIQQVVQKYDTGSSTIVENTKYTASIEVTGTKGKTTVTGTGLKTSYNVRSPGTNSVWSTLYDIKKVSDSNWEFWSRGWGHRVGMSQYGAQGRALAGQPYDQILKYYYTGANVVQYNIGRNVRIALSKTGSRVMRVTAKSEISLYSGSTLIKTVPANTEIRIEYN